MVLWCSVGDCSLMDDKINTKMETKGEAAKKHKDAAQDNNKNGDGDGPWFKQLPHILDKREYRDRLASPSVSIYKVPASIRSMKKEAFEPQVVSFGPISCRKDKQPCAMDHYKLDAVKRTLKRVNNGDGDGNVEIGRLVDGVKSMQKRIRDCYEDCAIEWDDQELACMLTMDACFILEFFRSCHENNGDFSLVFKNADNAFVNDIRMDILKLENQIPLFILKHILQLEGKNVAKFLVTLLENCPLFRGFPFSETLSCKEEIEDAKHLLDVCSKVITGYLTNRNKHQGSASGTGSRDQCSSCAGSDPSCGSVNVEIALCADSDTTQKSPSDTGNRRQRKFSAEKLKKAGIKFEADKGRVSFEDSTFSLHSITVDDKTDIVLRNLVAFEDCQKRKHPNIISEYIMLMEDLIDSEADVALLKNKDIIIRYTGSDKEIVDMFDTLCKGITASRENPFHTELVKVNEHYEDIRKLWKSEFKEKYCSRPWLISSLVAAIVLGALVVFQNVLNALKYMKK